MKPACDRGVVVKLGHQLTDDLCCRDYRKLAVAVASSGLGFAI